jgi:hypothetical protein
MRMLKISEIRAVRLNKKRFFHDSSLCSSRTTLPPALCFIFDMGRESLFLFRFTGGDRNGYWAAVFRERLFCCPTPFENPGVIPPILKVCPRLVRRPPAARDRCLVERFRVFFDKEPVALLSVQGAAGWKPSIVASSRS